jgi:CheY-like chemotaxis protein
MSASNKKTILVVDDDHVVLKAMSLVLTNNGYLVLTAECGADAISILSRNKPHLVLLDLDFPPDPASALSDGFLTYEWAHRFGLAYKVPFFILSALDPAQYQKRAEADGIAACFRKPVNERDLLEAIRAELGD